MPAYSYTSSYSQVFGKEIVAIADLPFSGQSYTWDFRSAILSAASAIPSPPTPPVGQQVLAWLSVFVPSLTINASAYSGAGSPAKIGSYAFLNQGHTYTGGFLNFTNQFLGNVYFLSENDGTFLSEGVIDFTVYAPNFTGTSPADGVLVSLSGGDVSGASLSITWSLYRQTSSDFTNSLFSYNGVP